MTIREASNKLMMFGLACMIANAGTDDPTGILKDLPEAIQIARKCMAQTESIKDVLEEGNTNE